MYMGPARSLELDWKQLDIIIYTMQYDTKKSEAEIKEEDVSDLRNGFL